MKYIPDVNEKDAVFIAKRTKSGANRRSVPSHRITVCSLRILPIFIPLANFHSRRRVIFSCCSKSLLISPAKKINKQTYPSSIIYLTSRPNICDVMLLPTLSSEMKPSIVATALMNKKLRFNMYRKFNVIKPIVLLS